MNTKKKPINYFSHRKNQTKRKKTKRRTRSLGHKRRNLGGSLWSSYGTGNSIMIYRKSHK